MSSFSVLIVEDQVVVAEDIREALERMGHHVCGIAISYQEGVSLLHSHQPDLVILDISLQGKKSGIDLAYVILKKYPTTSFIYLTSYFDRKTLKGASKTLPGAYLVKPFKDQDLMSAIEVSMQNHQAKIEMTDQLEGPGELIIKSDYVLLKIPFKDIMWLKADRNYFEIKTEAKTHRVRGRMDEYEKKLPPNRFIRIHRSYIINLDHVTEAFNGKVLMGGVSLPVSRRKWKELMARIKA